MLHRQHQLDDPGHAGRRLEVADVRLHRADEQRLVGLPMTAERGRERLHLDGVAERGARSVRLDVAHLVRRQPRVLERQPDHGLLGRAAGDGEAAAAPVLVERGPAHDREDAVAVGLRVGEALEDHDTAALTPPVAVRRGVERLAASVRREHAALGGQDEAGRCEDQVDARGQRHPAFTSAQALAREV